MRSISRIVTRIVTKLYPGITKDLYVSQMDTSLERFIKMCFMVGIVLSLIFMVPLTWMIFQAADEHPIPLTIFTFVILLFSCTIIAFRVPYFNKQRIGKIIESEVAVTGRRLLIQLESGKSLQNSIIDVAKNKKHNSKALEIVAYELFMGKNLEQVITDAIDYSPSKSFNKIFTQIKNSLRTGTDLKKTLRATLTEITREKTLEFETFGKKLGPVGMFYMFFGTIGPSIGVVIYAIVLTLAKVPIKLSVLSLFLFGTLIIQILFIAVFSKMRPELEI